MSEVQQGNTAELQVPAIPTKRPLSEIDDRPSSDRIDQVAKALSAAQSEMKPAFKDSRNPRFASEYASLAQVIEASAEALGKHGLSILPKISWSSDKLSMRSILLHSSGQWIDCGTLESLVVVPPPGQGKSESRINALQAAGNNITYLLRYSSGAICRLQIQKDTDGNGHPEPPERSEVPSDASNGPSSARSEYLPVEMPEQLWKPNQVPTPATRMWILNKLQAAPGQPNWAPLADWLRANKVIGDADTPAEWPLDMLPSTRTALEGIRAGLKKGGA